MPSSQSFEVSSPVSPSSTRRRRRSKFTYKNLSQLSQYSTICPLRVIAHIDLDAFYAQCEMVRLGVADDQPLAVQQWQGLIAINYPAREYGLSRHVTPTEAKKACPDIIFQHVATWKEGEDHWAYRDDAAEHIGTHKVSLDPYRLQSRKILAVIKESLPETPLQRVEKASIDEVFLDLSAHVHSILLERHPELSGPPPYDDSTEKLPSPPTTVLDWAVDALVDLDEGQSEEDDPDWDDICMQIGSEIIRGVRDQIRQRLNYTCSAGVARNKMLAKLGSGHKKPNKQTIIRNRAVQHFLSGFKFTKIRNLGGKLGDEAVSMFGTDSVSDLLNVPIDQLKKLGDDTGTWLHGIIRGEDHSEVNPRTQIKSMLSAKSFRPSISTFEQAVRWLRIFVGDIYSRLVEEGVTENKRRPKTINLHHRQGYQTRSKQAPIPGGKTIDEALLFGISKDLMAQVIVDGRAWPCTNLSLSVGGFEDGPTGNRGIGSFLVKGDEAKALNLHANERASPMPDGPLAKRRRVDSPRISQFFGRDESRGEHESEHEPADFDELPSAQARFKEDEDEEHQRSPQPEGPGSRSSTPEPVSSIEVDTGAVIVAQHSTELHQSKIDTFFCERCKKSLLKDQEEEHNDWHFAKDVQQEEQKRSAGAPSQPTKHPTTGLPHKAVRGRGQAGRGRGRPPGNASSHMEKGQSRLTFGK